MELLWSLWILLILIPLQVCLKKVWPIQNITWIFLINYIVTFSFNVYPNWLQRPFQAFFQKKSGSLFLHRKERVSFTIGGKYWREELCRIIGAVCVFNLKIFHCYFRYVKLNSKDGWLLPLWNIRQNISKQSTLIILIWIKPLIFSTYLKIHFVSF